MNEYWTNEEVKNYIKDHNCKWLVSHDNRKWEIDHVSEQTIFLKTLFSKKDYNGRQQNKLDKNGLCRLPITDISNLLYCKGGYHFES